MPAGRADELVAALEVGALAEAHTWIAENSAPQGVEERFEDGWDEGVAPFIGCELESMFPTRPLEKFR